MYVWLDALFNYFSAIQTEDLKKFWPPDLQIVGKDILRFHAIYWPAFLMAYGIDLPKRIFAHGWWTVDGAKMSKSIGNVIDPFKLQEEFGLDYLRYYLMREMPFGNDHSYTKDLFINRINSELCNNIGNLCQRVLVFVEKNADSIVPDNSCLNNEDNLLINSCYDTLNVMRENIDKQMIHLAFGAVVKLGVKANEYIDKNAPWILKKTDSPRLAPVLYALIEVIRNIGILFLPLIPESASKILDNLRIDSEYRTFKHIKIEYSLKPGHELPSSKPIFPRIV